MIKLVFDLDKQGKAVLQSNYLDNIREHFSIKDPIAKLKQLRYGAFMPSRLYAITPAGKFQIGMFADIVEFIKSTGAQYNMIVTQPFKKKFFCGYKATKDDIVKLNIPLRDYQISTIIRDLKLGHGTNVVATAGGKTLIMATLIQTIRKLSTHLHRTLIIVPGIQLVEQTANDFIEYGIPASEISKWSGDNELNNNAPIVIAGINILQSKNTNSTIYENVDLLIVDEVHKVRKTNEINKILDKIHTINRFGFTGTLPESKIDQWNIIGRFGPILIEKTSKELRIQKHIADVTVQVIKINYTKPMKYETEATFIDPLSRYNEECDYLHINPFRNTIISKLAHKVDKNILVLVDRIDHGELLKQVCENLSTKKQVFFIRGSVGVDEREEIRKLMESHDDVICIAMAAIFSTGINIKNLHYVLFACGGKAKVRIIQSIGRGLRLHENKDKLYILDIADNFHYSLDHLQKRLVLYDKENIHYEIKDIEERSKDI